MILAGVGDQYWHVRVLIQYLLNATVVNALLAFRRLLTVTLEIIFVLIFSIGQSRYIIRWLRRYGRRWRGAITVVGSFELYEYLVSRALRQTPLAGGEASANLRGETAPECIESERWPSGRSNAPYGLLSSSFHMACDGSINYCSFSFY